MKVAAIEARDVEYGVNGVLTIGSPPAIGNIYIPERIKRFHQEYPACPLPVAGREYVSHSGIAECGHD